MKNRTLSIVWRTVIFGVLIMALGLTFLRAVGTYMTDAFGEGLRTVIILAALFVVWLVHGSTLRSIYRLDNGASFLYLLSAGVLTISGGVGLAYLISLLPTTYIEFNFFANVESTGQERTMFVLGASLFLSVFSSINLKVKNRFFGNFLEFVLIVGAVICLLWLTK